MQHNYARAFRIVRAASGLKQAELADKMPITASQLSLIEAGKRQPSLKVVEALSKALDVPAPLITLLACTADEVKPANNDIADLAQSLLTVLVSVEPEGAGKESK